MEKRRARSSRKPAAPRLGRLPPGATSRDAARLAGIGLLAVGVAAALFVAGRLHPPDYAFSLFGQTGLAAVALKSALASIAVAAAGLQVLLALWLYRKLPLAGRPSRAVRPAHRVCGFALLALTLPIAVHCLFTYGVQLTSLRAAVHSLAGCFLFGAFAGKVTLVHSGRLPRWALPVTGGTLAVIIGVLWYTSALWYYNGFRLPGT